MIDSGCLLRNKEPFSCRIRVTVSERIDHYTTRRGVEVIVAMLVASSCSVEYETVSGCGGFHTQRSTTVERWKPPGS
jgi:hypothetical protein